MEPESDELLLLSSLRFAPIDPQPRRTLVNENGRVNINQRVELLQLQLQKLISQQQDALSSGTGNLEAIRGELPLAMRALRDAYKEDVAKAQFKVIQLLAEREDTESVQARIEDLTSKHAEEPDVLPEAVELRNLEEDLVRLRQQIKVLETRKVEVARHVADRQRARHQTQLETAKELERLTSMPTYESLSSAIQSLNLSIDRSEEEAAALDAGSELLESILEFLRTSETQFAESLRNHPSDKDILLDKIETITSRLDQWLENIREKHWNLLEVFVSSERETYETARALILRSSTEKGKNRERPSSRAAS